MSACKSYCVVLTELPASRFHKYNNWKRINLLYEEKISKQQTDQSIC